jgi:hypothetical protein
LEYLSKVIINRVGADEELGGDLAVGLSGRGKFGDLA